MTDTPISAASLREKIHRLEAELAATRLQLKDRLERGSQDLLPRVGAWSPPLPSAPHSQAGTWVWNLANDRVQWSPQLYQILGYVPGEVTASTDGFLAVVEPAERAQVRHALEPHRNDRTAASIRFHVRRPDGEIRQAIVEVITVCDDSGAPSHLIGTVIDLTESLLTEEFLRRQQYHFDLAQRSAGIGSWTFDLTSKTIEWSRELYRILGVEPSVRPTAAYYFSLVHPEDLPIARAAESTFLSGSAVDAHEYRILRASDGEMRHVVTAGIALHDADNRLLGFLGTTMDITDRKQLEFQVAQSVKMEALGRLAGGIAHDFNNLLTVIQGYCQLLTLQEEQPELVHIAEAAEAAGRLTQHLLQFSRQSAVATRTLDLNSIIERSVALLGRIIGEDIEVTLDLEEKLWPIIADPGHMEQILFNLAANSRDAMPSGGALTISTRNRPAEDGLSERVDLRVEDSGNGMTPEVVENAFEPFYTTKDRGKGTGLGLSTVFGIVTQNRGTIDVESSPGAGTTMTILLPRSTEDPMGIPATAPIPLKTGPLSILAVEDEPMIARLLHRVLSRAGYQPVIATTPSLAIERLYQLNAPADLVISDVVMPEMSGPALVAKLRQLQPHLPVLFISGYPAGNLDLEGLGAEGFLAKPFTPSELVAAVEAVVHSKPLPRRDP